MNVFKLLITGIAAIAIVYFISQMFFLQPQKTFEEVLAEGLTKAELNIGQTYFENIQLPSTNQINFAGFDNKSRTVNFECNSSDVCCDKGIECGKIYWEDRILKIPNSIQSKLVFRCNQIETIHACTIYIGKLPAQLEFKKTPTYLDFKHEDNYLIFSNELTNTGEKPEVNEITVEVKVYRIEEGKRILHFTETKKIQSLYPRNTQIFNYEIPAEKLNFNTEFEIELLASAHNSGQDKKIIKLQVSNAQQISCNTNQQQTALAKPELVNDQCIKKLYCNNCNLAAECFTLWKTELFDSEIQLIDPEYAYQILPFEECQ